MTVDKALSIINQAIGEVIAKREAHITMQEAYDTVVSFVQEHQKPAEETEQDKSAKKEK